VRAARTSLACMSALSLILNFGVRSLLRFIHYRPRAYLPLATLTQVRFFLDWYSLSPESALRFSESMIATACFWLLTGLPEPPDFKAPAFHLCITWLYGINHSLTA
jgi:hypothetical protein